ncbi:vitamin K epoxide reductase family protein [Intrasporangium sp.]|uniref:vitamin K epoxide reductase family protein n=1 Tax=Intrasporangium sp. TaxID=1925024 RepID=UPI00293A0B09|nr:vitamin K epoxide reductase family protein [Intrasporangium sp.]MDV3223120.1 vitamin K epoxide reductase family protein [Intrasporangium sp.]
MTSRPRWLAPTSLVLSIVGLLVSAYLTFEHYTGNETLACTVTEVIDCGKVTSSAWSTFLGIPVALLGLLFFVALTALVLPPVWRRPEPWLDRVRFGWVTVGLGMALYLVWAELFQIHAICSWCTVVHVVTFILWIVILFGQILSTRDDGGAAEAAGPAGAAGAGGEQDAPVSRPRR